MLTGTLTEALAAILADIEVAPDFRHAAVAGRAVTATGPAEMTYRLGRAIYEVHHVGWAQPPAERDLTGKDECFEQRLVAAMPHRSVIRAGRLLSACQDHDHIEIEGVKVTFPRGDVGRGPGGAGDVAVRLPAWRPALSPGFLVADGTRALEVTGDLLRVYVHLRTEDALVNAWRIVLDALEEQGTGYRAKATSAPGLLPRRDALVVYLGDAGQAAPALIAERLGAARGELSPGRDVSAFAERVGPGVATGWEPRDRRAARRGLSFGEHRASAIAEGLLEHAGTGRPDRTGLAAAVSRALVRAGIDPACPARNLPG